MKEFFSLPNLLSDLRIALVPIFAILLLTGHPYWALTIFVIASLTDAADGFIARKWNLVTNIGKVLDPFADKLLKITVLACFISVNLIPLWFLIAMLMLDLSLIIAASILFKREVVIKSNYIGKAGTAIISIGILLAFFAPALNNFHLIVLYCGLVVVFASAISYLLVYLKINKSIKNEK